MAKTRRSGKTRGHGVKRRTRMRGGSASGAPSIPPGAATAVPPDNAFVYRNYRPSPNTKPTWGDLLKEYASSKAINTNTKLARLESYKAKLINDKIPDPEGKKRIAFGNRIKELLTEKLKEQQAAAAASGAAAASALPQDTKAGVVIRFSDGQALYVITESGALGFPKGSIDMIRHPATGAAYRETSREAALRELKEETGFEVQGSTLKRKEDPSQAFLPGQYTITGIREERRVVQPKKGQTEKAYYLIFDVSEDSKVVEPDIKNRTPAAMKEKIQGYRISPQDQAGGLGPFNYFSLGPPF